MVKWTGVVVWLRLCTRKWNSPLKFCNPFPVGSAVPNDVFWKRSSYGRLDSFCPVHKRMKLPSDRGAARGSPGVRSPFAATTRTLSTPVSCRNRSTPSDRTVLLERSTRGTVKAAGNPICGISTLSSRNFFPRENIGLAVKLIAGRRGESLTWRARSRNGVPIVEIVTAPTIGNMGRIGCSWIRSVVMAFTSDTRTPALQKGRGRTFTCAATSMSPATLRCTSRTTPVESPLCTSIPSTTTKGSRPALAPTMTSIQFPSFPLSSSRMILLASWTSQRTTSRITRHSLDSSISSHSVLSTLGDMTQAGSPVLELSVEAAAIIFFSRRRGMLVADAGLRPTYRRGPTPGGGRQLLPVPLGMPSSSTSAAFFSLIVPILSKISDKSVLVFEAMLPRLGASPFKGDTLSFIPTTLDTLSLIPTTLDL
mmetsp:Transcript_58140/g.185005  ORF Transcript_58140/g.185005 Transcript_58140/m.185005 type:complete len:423 (+) Transcript_58140:1910-3178(+)